ncbi:MAG: hypothetical protein IBJ18_02110 [Phycisphaerales bacterium]|nr:hypothetical protein [Phycisphaerales bacterium]
MTKHASKASRADELVKRCEELALGRADEARLAVRRVLNKCTVPEELQPPREERDIQGLISPAIYLDEMDRPLERTKTERVTKAPPSIGRADRFKAEIQRVSATTVDTGQWSTNEQWEAVVMFLILNERVEGALGPVTELYACVSDTQGTGSSRNLALARAQAKEQQWSNLLDVVEQSCARIMERSPQRRLTDVLCNLGTWQKIYYAAVLIVGELQSPRKHLPDQCWEVAFEVLEGGLSRFDEEWPVAFYQALSLEERNRVRSAVESVLSRLSKRPHGNTGEIQAILLEFSELLLRLMRRAGWWTVDLQPAEVQEPGEQPAWRKVEWVIEATKRDKPDGYVELKARELRRLASRGKVKSLNSGKGKQNLYDVHSLINCPDLSMYRKDLQAALDREDGQA